MAKAKKNDVNLKPFILNLEKTLKTIPPKIGMLAFDHFDKSFANQGFTDTTLQPWKKTKSGKQNYFGSPTKRAILIRSGRLRRGIRRGVITARKVQIINDVPYAEAHNEGFRGIVNVSAHTRSVKTFSYNIKTHKRSKRPTGKSEVKVKAHRRNMNMPRRRFMGASAAMERDIKMMIVREVNQAINQSFGTHRKFNNLLNSFK
jgi:phage gpG-like protein